MRNLVLLVATRKGAWIYRSDDLRREWHVDGPHFLGHVIHHLVLDPRDGKPGVWYAGTSPHGLFRSEDGGANLGESGWGLSCRRLSSPGPPRYQRR